MDNYILKYNYTSGAKLDTAPLILISFYENFKDKTSERWNH